MAKFFIELLLVVAIFVFLLASAIYFSWRRYNQRKLQMQILPANYEPANGNFESTVIDAQNDGSLINYSENSVNEAPPNFRVISSDSPEDDRIFFVFPGGLCLFAVSDNSTDPVRWRVRIGSASDEAIKHHVPPPTYESVMADDHMRVVDDIGDNVDTLSIRSDSRNFDQLPSYGEAVAKIVNMRNS